MFCDDDRSKLVPESTYSVVTKFDNLHEISKVNICHVTEKGKPLEITQMSFGHNFGSKLQGNYTKISVSC